MHTSGEDLPPGSRHSNLKRSFKLGVRSLLAAVSKEDVYKAFPAFSNLEKERLHCMFIQVIRSLHENLEDEFEVICQETKVGSTLDTVEQQGEEQTLDRLFAEALDAGEVKEKIAQAKKDEISYLKSLISQAEKQNTLMKTRIESLTKGKEDASAATSAISKLSSWNSRHGSFFTNSTSCDRFDRAKSDHSSV